MTSSTSTARGGPGADPSSGWAAHAREELARNGYRLGGARAVVIGVLADHACAASAAELHDAARAAGADVGLASVYRTLELLEELGVAKRVELGERGARYEAVGPSDHHHHHMVCDDCGTVEPFEDELLERALADAARRSGFTPSTHEVVFQGHCGSCESAESS